MLERLAERYLCRPALHAIELLNEPRWDIDTDLLKKYTTDGYHRIRKYYQPKDVAVVFHDGFRSFREYTGFLTEPEFSNVVFAFIVTSALSVKTLIPTFTGTCKRPPSSGKMKLMT